MTKFCTNRNKQTILIESIPYSNWEIEMVRMNIPADNRSFRQELFSFYVVFQITEYSFNCY